MKSKHICPKCGNREFYTTAHVVQEWRVDENGEYLDTAEPCLEVVAEPDDDNIWLCTKCMTDGVIHTEEPDVNELMIVFSGDWMYYKTCETTVEEALAEWHRACSTAGVNTDNLKITRLVLRDKNGNDIAEQEIRI